ncbi:MAG: tetratricopeptide repeat protein, partial [Candidatus Aminicenantes bacterium]|nr:tetratricopeptide repeat protein [Candidatus Aminicenantes bacterium]
KFDEAVRDFEACLKVLPERPSLEVSRLGQAYGRAGRREDARRILVELEQASRRGYVSPVAKAYVHAGLGQNDDVFRLLEEALEARDSQLLYTSFHPFGMDTCVKDPRWPDLMSRISRAARMPEGVKPGGKP